MKLKLSDLIDAHMMVDGYDNEAFICRQTGTIHLRSDYVDPDDPPPDDLDDEDKYFAIPSQQQLDLGKPLAIEFAREHLPDDVDNVYDIFRRRGAFARFKALLSQKGALDQWYAYEEKAQEAALLEWCAENEIEIDNS